MPARDRFRNGRYFNPGSDYGRQNRVAGHEGYTDRRPRQLVMLQIESQFGRNEIPRGRAQRFARCPRRQRTTVVFEFARYPE